MKHPVRTLLLVLLAWPFLLASSCRSPGPAATASPLEGTWLVESSSRDGVTEVWPDTGKVPVSVTFAGAAGGRLHGWDGVNRFSGEYEVGTGGSLTISPMVSTRRAGPPEAMERAEQLLTTLQVARRFAVEGETLRIVGDAGSLELRRQATHAAGGAP